ncbi:MAG: S8 family serine peptidase [Actinomycetota bacterium]|nr:S8 family serine peptidase [Actinomycetota bacterium]
MRLRRTLFGIAVVVVAVAVLLPVGAASPASLSIDSVGGQTVQRDKVRKPVSGLVEVRGRANLGPAAEDDQPPLVADAGDSAFVAVGEKATLLGSGFGGTAPYTFAWSASAGALEGADAATAQFDTTAMAPGTYDVSLVVTDASGAKDSDTVKVVVYEGKEVTLLDQSEADGTPGVIGLGAPGSVVFPFDVPSGVSRMDVTATWLVPANDYDLRVLYASDAGDTERASSGNAPPGTQEQASVAKPEQGEWEAAVDKFATVADEVTVKVTATVVPADPRPAVSAGGPYRFAIGTAQRLAGTVTGGSDPVKAAWDTDGDGVFETEGAEPTVALEEGRHLVTLKATDDAGLERRQTTSVLVADPARVAEETTAVTVIGVADTGINPYHFEFSADTYPDPDVLALTANFTRHPSEYIPGYPADAEALPVTLGQGYFPPSDENIWKGNDTVKAGKLYWIPGTKIVGAVDAGGSTGANTGQDTHPILDDNGHGSGSASVSAGNRYGYCPTCLLVVVEALDEAVVAGLPWVDISSNSFGYVGGLPIGLALGPSKVTRDAAERGQTTLFAAGNGVANAFDVPISTYGSDQTGNDWNITVGAIRRDNRRAIVGDGIPVHISAWGDGNLPSACRTGTVGQCAFGGTSAATPYTAGVFGTVLTAVRQVVGDGAAGQKAGQVVAQGVALAGSNSLSDGKLTRAELREAVLKTAQPLNQDNEMSPFPYPLTAPYLGEGNVLFEGYGAATPESAKRAIDVLLGKAGMPVRPFEDDFFAIDRGVRDTLYGGYDRNGDGKDDFEGLAGLGLTPAKVSDVEGTMAALRAVAARKAPAAVARQPLGENAQRYFLHRRYAGTPEGAAKPACDPTSNESYLDTFDNGGDLEPCFESRVTSVAAAYRPLGIFPLAGTLDAPLPVGSRVHVELFLTTESPAVVRPGGVLMATDREIGTGPGPAKPVTGSGPTGAGCSALGEACWTSYQFAFDTKRPAFAGEQITFQVQLVGTRSWAFGFEGGHASSVTVEAAKVPPSGFDFGASIAEPAEGARVPEGQRVVAGGTAAFPDPGSDPTGAGDHPSRRRVEVSVDNVAFTTPVEARLDPEKGTWSAPLGKLSPGTHTVYARAGVGDTVSQAASQSFVVVPDARVEWQVVKSGASPVSDGWRGTEGFGNWAFTFDTADYGTGVHAIVTRVVAEGAVQVERRVDVRFR